LPLFHSITSALSGAVVAPLTKKRRQKHIKAKKIKAAEIHPQSTSASLLGLAIFSFEFMPANSGRHSNAHF